MARLKFTKMQGAGNDFVVLDATRAPLPLTPELVRRLGDRHFGIGADQILVVQPPPSPDVDFGYRIFNHSGDEVEHCGNGARCFVRYVRDKGLTTQDTVRVRTLNRTLVLHWEGAGRVRVDMGAPRFDHAALPFEPGELQPRRVQGFELWPLPVIDATLEAAVLSMGNPHAVIQVPDVEAADVASLGPEVEVLPHFPAKVNVGFMQVLAPDAIALRVFERDAGETLACGTGACAAVVAGIRLGLLEPQVQVRTRGGLLGVGWDGRADAAASVSLSGPAETVFEGEIEL